MTEPDERRLLLIDDEPAQARLVAVIAARARWRLTRAGDLDEALAELARGGVPVDAILVDRWRVGDELGPLVTRLRHAAPGTPILILTAVASIGHAVAAMRSGATDYLVKPITPERLLAALEAAAGNLGGAGELRPLSEKIVEPLAFEEIVGSAPEFRAALAIAAKAARARVPVLIEGESGVGKDVAARAIHTASPRSRRPLVVLDCAATPANLLESELFGHERGAFTGAFDRHVGRFQQADGGTLFLDEIGALPPDTQLRLLKALQAGEILPLGGRHPVVVDVRVIAATNRTLLEDVAAGRFREDLYYRLAVVHLSLPPLRARTGDVPALARHLLGRIARQPGMRALGITDEAIALLMRFDWPGNVRQLHSALFRAAMLCEGDALTPADFPQIAAEAENPTARVATPGPSAHGAGVTLYEPNGHLRPLEAIEADVIRLAIGHYRGRMTEVARRLGIGRSTLYRKLGELGIDNAA